MKATHWSHAGDKGQEPLHYTECGLDDVYLVSGYERETTPYGDGIIIRDLDNLHRAIGIYLVQEKKVLNGKEIRFLRKQMDLTQSELSRYFGLSHQQVARWEKGQSEITESAASLLRLLYLGHVCGKVDVRKLLDDVLQTDAGLVQQRACFRKTEDGWRPSLAA